ncbi:DUF4190 domain-containing protein [Homoserinimonas hongtaonis]|uniref:DUF4190 domain-containing protein n=1 Tax=Homoserinimonas hongtaonis TaxID=2079791 RepID=UPI000D3364EE|nr:DUF4190 domain-containing protein [Salinibacterium hongtaonis]AWB89506.1 hypothetical protein C2138_08090 [Salinibacterium hongtaonis]
MSTPPLSPASSPEADAPQPATPDSGASTVTVGGIAVAALVMGILAFLAGWIPIVGALFGITGLILGIIALVRRKGRGMGITAVILSTLAIIASVITTVLAITLLPLMLVSFANISDDVTDGIADQVVPPQIVETPCYGFDAPSGYINSQSAADQEACWTTLELRGELNENGEFINTGEGDIFGSIYVEPVDSEIVASWGVGLGGDSDDLDAAVTYLADAYFSQLGTVTTLNEPMTIDGAAANITRLDNGAGPDTTNVVIATFSPSTYALESESETSESKFWVITVATMDDDGDDILERMIDTWQWR